MKNSKVIWLFGLSGAGKTTIADLAAEALRAEGEPVMRLDGDDLRTGLCADLGFSAEDRHENLRRASHTARLIASNGICVIASFISPLQVDRDTVAEILGDKGILVYVNTSLSVCESRDPKGLYRRARGGELKSFTGVSAPFEPAEGGVRIATEGREPEESATELLDLIRKDLIRKDLMRKSSH